MTITAKFSSICPCCNGRINAGEKVEWSRGRKARHVRCAGSPVSPEAAAPRTRRAAYQGRQDCRKYGWDGVVGSGSYYTSGQYDEDS